MTPDELIAELLAKRAEYMALPAGVESVQFNNRNVQLASQEARDNAVANIDRQIAALQGVAGATYHLAATSKGY